MCLLSNSHLLPRRVPRSLLANIPPTWTVSGHLQCCHGAPSHQDLPPAFSMAAGTFLYNVHQIAFLSCLNPDARTIAFGIKSEVLAMAACPRAPAFAYPSPPGASFSMLFTGLHSLRPSFLPWNTPSSFPPQDLCVCGFLCLELSLLRAQGTWLLLTMRISAEKRLLGENSPSPSQVPLPPHPTSMTYSLITQCHFLYITIYHNLDVFSYSMCYLSPLNLGVNSLTAGTCLAYLSNI